MSTVSKDTGKIFSVVSSRFVQLVTVLSETGRLQTVVYISLIVFRGSKINNSEVSVYVVVQDGRTNCG